VAKIRFEIPQGGLYYRVSQDFPEATIEVTATHVLSDGRVMAELDVLASDFTEFIEALGREPGVVSVANVATLGPTARCQIMAQTPPYILLAGDLEVLIRYPRIIQAGAFTVEVASRVSQLQKLIEGLHRFYPVVQVLRFGRDRMRTSPGTITAQQHALLHQALAAGYFEVPRRITLTRLAHKLGKSKSSLSRGLALIEEKLAESIAASRS